MLFQVPPWMETRLLTGSGLWAVVPIKTIEHAKQRLSSLLSESERQYLFRAMVGDVLDALADATRLAGVVVVTRDTEAKRLAGDVGARILVEDEDNGHTAASSFGAQTLAKEGIAGMLQVPGDLPLLRARDIDKLIDAHKHAPAVTIAPSRDKCGSNGVACSPPHLLPLRFGDNSFYPHLERAKSLGVEPTIIENQGFALDIDTPDDLRAFLKAPFEGRTLTYLRESGLAERIGDETRP